MPVTKRSIIRGCSSLLCVAGGVGALALAAKCGGFWQGGFLLAVFAGWIAPVQLLFTRGARSVVLAVLHLLLQAFHAALLLSVALGDKPGCEQTGAGTEAAWVALMFGILPAGFLLGLHGLLRLIDWRRDTAPA